MRNIRFSEDEYYHVYNRGVDKRTIFKKSKDYNRFLQGITGFNVQKILGNLERSSGSKEEPLVEIVAYCLNPNHFHFILRPVTEKGIEKFMHKLGMGYAKYFNTKYRRSGALFQGRFKAIHIDSDEYLLHLSAYINLNNEAHKKIGESRSSWNEYVDEFEESICEKEIILGQFKNRREYSEFARESLKKIIERKDLLKQLEDASLLTPGVNIFI